MNKRWYRIVQDVAGWGKHCFASPHFVVLVLLMLFAWGTGAALDSCLSKGGSSMTISFYRLFDFAMISKAPTTGLKIVSLLEFLFTWAIGSGILLTILVDRTLNYYRQVREGAVRYRIFGRSHAIILGWNPTALVHIKELLDYNEYCTSHKADHSQAVKTLLILSECPVDVIQSQLRTIDTPDLGKIEILFYRGAFDSKTEMKFVHLDKSVRLYVVGEESDSEDIRDSRTLIVLGKIKDDAQIKKRKSVLPCCIWISKLALYHRLTKAMSNEKLMKVCATDEARGDVLNVRYLNFYNNWAHRLWGLYPSKLTPQIYGSLFHTVNGKRRTVRAVLVGFSQMGQAVMEFILRSGYLGDKSATGGSPNVKIDIIDNKVDERKSAFEERFPAIDWDLLKKHAIEVSFKEYDVHDAEFDSFLRDVYYRQLNGFERLIVVLGFEGADDMLTTALAIKEIVGRNVPIFIRQNLSGGVCGIKELSSLVENVFPFGSKSGAGYNYWRCEKLFETLCNHLESVSLVSPEYCEMVPSIFAASGFLLREIAGCKGEDSKLIPNLRNNLDIRDAIHKCKMMEVLMAAADRSGNKKVDEKWIYSTLSTDETSAYEKLQAATIEALQDIGYSLEQIDLNNIDFSNGGITETGNKFLTLYGATQKELENVDNERNPFSEKLKRHGEKLGKRYVAMCKESGVDVEFVIGGSLAYDAVLKDRYDIDIRLLVKGNASDDVSIKNKLVKIKTALAKEFSHGECQIKQIEGKDEQGHIILMWKLTRPDEKVDEIGRDVTVNCIIETWDNYVGIASIASLLPKPIIDRLVFAKSKALSMSDGDYRALKRHWKDFMRDLKGDGIANCPNSNIIPFLMERNYNRIYPVFLQERV